MFRQRFSKNIRNDLNVQVGQARRLRTRMAAQRFMIIVMVLCASGLGPVSRAHASTTFVVNSTADSGGGTLRWAIESANLTPGLDTIAFNLPGGSLVIQPASALPEITDPVVIDGATQPDFDGAPIVRIDFSRATVGIAMGAGSSGSTFRGLALDGAIHSAAIMLNTDGNVVAGNFIGTFPTVAVPLGSQPWGISILGGSYNRIGGPLPGDRNLISGNNTGILIRGEHNVVQGNYIGTDSTGRAGLPNTSSGISIENGGSYNTVGPNNVISGNGSNGVRILGAGVSSDPPPAGNIVRGNFIGLIAGGTAALGNTEAGIQIIGKAHDNLIGGTTPADRNVISGNGGYGVLTTRDGTALSALTGNSILGNYIGTNASGNAAVRNGLGGVLIEYGARNTIGPGNLISGNQGNGVNVTSLEVDYPVFENVVRGNFIGTNSTGTAPLPNTGAGIRIAGFSNSNVVGGNFAVDRNVISGNGGDGVEIARDGNGGIPSGSILWGNYIGTNATGNFALPNQLNGVSIEGNIGNTFVGGNLPSNGNVISGNARAGVSLDGATHNTIQSNAIGLTASGTGALGNGSHGIALLNDAGANFINGNRIARNGSAGVYLYFSGTGNNIQGNSIFDNVRLGIDLLKPSGPNSNDSGDRDSGSNGLQNYPNLTTVTIGLSSISVSGSLDSLPNQAYLVELFASPTCDSSSHGEGQRSLALITINTDASGRVSFTAKSLTGVQVGQFITSTATASATADTSEFSRCLEVR